MSSSQYVYNKINFILLGPSLGLGNITFIFIHGKNKQAKYTIYNILKMFINTIELTVIAFTKMNVEINK